ncbi:hypothetical protein QJQ45_017848 [Haematococcus lacustris]|nr:hypothetical protein QJQ45_017848 [Haematococcus lacustris]
MLRHSIPLLLAMSGALVCCAAAGAWGADLLDAQPSDTRRSLQQQPNTFPFARYWQQAQAAAAATSNAHSCPDRQQQQHLGNTMTMVISMHSRTCTHNSALPAPHTTITTTSMTTSACLPRLVPCPTCLPTPPCSCTSYSCLASPYYLEPPSITAITANLALVCLRLRLRMATNTTVTTTTSSGGSGGAGGQRLCSAAQGPCCSQLASSLHQISIRTSARCSSAITNVLLDNQATNYAVTSVGGSRDAAIVVGTDPTCTAAQAIAFVSPLSLSGANAEGRLLCLTVRPPCTDTGLLFAGQPLSGVTYAVMESGNNACWSVPNPAWPPTPLTTHCCTVLGLGRT